jgi:WD40-like Beta Propeller Repeat./Bacterial Ig-like domain (group 2).
LTCAPGQARKISDSKARYDAPRWSPDGTRIAYSRPENFCIADSDGSHARCRGLDGWRLGGELGWVDTHRIYISGEHNGVQISLAIVDVDNGTVTDPGISAGTVIRTDPSGGWLLSATDSNHPTDHRISPSARYDLSKPVTSDSTPPASVVFLTPRLSGSFLDKVGIVAAHQPLAPGVPHQLSAAGWTHDGRSIKPSATHWRSLTPDVATIDSLGVMVASRDGIASVEVSAGGWRKDVATIRIARSSPKLLVEEKWDVGVNSRWRVFGNPSPGLVGAHDTVAFLNNGDGAFFSGAYMKRTFSARDGLAMDIDVSTLITRTQWQLFMAALQPLSAQSRIQEWDHKTGYMTGLNNEQGGCWFVYPNGEGKESITRARWHESMLLAEGTIRFESTTARGIAFGCSCFRTVGAELQSTGAPF